ncbi:hypothetical protein D7X33_26015, partial [Butyricicoccus sp. 1XD8-22]
MTRIRSEEEAEAIIQEMIKRTKTDYITQAVTFNKNKSRHLELLKFALMSSESFGGFMKELLAEKYND